MSASFFPSFREGKFSSLEAASRLYDEASLDSRVRSVPTLAMNGSGGFDLLENLWLSDKLNGGINSRDADVSTLSFSLLPFFFASHSISSFQGWEILLSSTYVCIRIYIYRYIRQMGLNLQGKRTCIYVAIINSSCSHSRVPEFGKFSLSVSLWFWLRLCFDRTLKRALTAIDCVINKYVLFERWHVDWLKAGNGRENNVSFGILKYSIIPCIWKKYLFIILCLRLF